tara:strand:+ start:269 stop:2650 length:2382 start_codon:yes stop_codon:yes gene_type:complete
MYAHQRLKSNPAKGHRTNDDSEEEEEEEFKDLDFDFKDEEDLCRTFLQHQKSKRTCCARGCFKNFRLSDARKVWRSVMEFRTVSPRKSDGQRLFMSFIRTCYHCSVVRNLKPGGSGIPEKTKVYEFLIPMYGQHVCRTFFLEFFCIGVKVWRGVTTSKSFLPEAHALRARAGKDANHYCPEKNENVIKFVQDLARDHGMPWPVRVRLSKPRGDDSEEEDFHQSTEYIMPASFTMREIYRLFCKAHDDLSISWKAFNKLLNSDELENIRINKSEAGVCGTCLSLCRSLRKLRADSASEEKRQSLLERLRLHLNLSVAARRAYKEDQQKARASSTIDGRKELATLSFDFATNMKVPIFQMETQQGYQGKQKGLDFKVFGVVDEGTGNQTNLIYKEGRTVDADDVISLLHFYLTEINPAAGKAKKLILWVDSCSGQNRNQFMMQYLYSRVIQGFHEEVLVKFMVVGHTKFAPDRGFGQNHLRVSGRDIYSGPAFFDALRSDKNFPMEPPARIFRNWRETFKKYYRDTPGICATDIICIRIRVTETDTRLVELAWAERGELGQELRYEAQPQLLKLGRGRTIDVNAAVQDLKKGIFFDEHYSNFPPSKEDGLITMKRKKGLLDLLLPELERLSVDQADIDWWKDLPSLPEGESRKKKDRGKGKRRLAGKSDSEDENAVCVVEGEVGNQRSSLGSISSDLFDFLQPQSDEAEAEAPEEEREPEGELQHDEHIELAETQTHTPEHEPQPVPQPEPLDEPPQPETPPEEPAPRESLSRQFKNIAVEGRRKRKRAVDPDFV